jgi:superfamily II RNA helicase
MRETVVVGCEEEAPEPEFSRRYSYRFDDFQIEAMRHIRAGSSVMVAAPTSSGKTVIAEYAIWCAISAGQRVVYTTPIKALSNQKLRDFEALFPGRVGLLTGDRSQNRDAQILVMTTEVLRNMLIEDQSALASVRFAVLDEVHYIADPERGTVWEESIVRCPPEMNLVCLSATMANASEVADWIRHVHGPIELIQHNERPVPLQHFVFAERTLRLIRDANGKRVAQVPQPDFSHRRSLRQLVDQPGILNALRKRELLPAIWFVFTRRGAELDAQKCASVSLELQGAHADAVGAAIERMLDYIPAVDRELPQVASLQWMLRRGIGFHHAGLLPPCKELVEELFVAGHLSIVCATDTLSVGINMPARTVVISSLSRPVGGLLSPNDFSQLTGRAGRRGIDRMGSVVLLPSPKHDFERAYRELTGPLVPVNSTFALRYSTYVSLLAHHGGSSGGKDRIERFVRSSLSHFQMQSNGLWEHELRGIDETLANLPRMDDSLGTDQELLEYFGLQSRLHAIEKSHAASRPRSGRATGKMVRRQRLSSQAHQNIESLRALVRLHPMHELVASARSSEDSWQRLTLLRRKAQVLNNQDESRGRAEARAAKSVRGVRGVLQQLGYVNEAGATPKARGLRAMVSPGGIVISEMYHAGRLREVTPVGLAECLSWFAFDTSNQRRNYLRLSPEMRWLRNQALDVFGYVEALERRHDISLAQGPSGWFWGVAEAWARGGDIASIVKHIEVGEGDVVSSLSKTVDLLEQLEECLRHYDDMVMIAVIAEAKTLLLRGLVAFVRSNPLEVEPVVLADAVP